ncbi:MAG: cation transporter [Candidatus Latescibacterota bacterium]
MRLSVLCFALVSAAAVVLVSCTQQAQPERTAVPGAPDSTALAQTTFDVQGMTCASCNVAVKLAAERVPGVHRARASHGEQRAWVTYDPARTSAAAIAAAITNAGYQATPVAAAGAPDSSSDD